MERPRPPHYQLCHLSLLLCPFCFFAGIYVSPDPSLDRVFTPKFGKKNAGTQSFQDCVIRESIRCESVSADLDVMSKLAILWMMSVDGVNGLYLSGAKKMCQTLQIRKIRVQVIIKLGSFFYSKNYNESYFSRIHV